MSIPWRFVCYSESGRSVVEVTDSEYTEWCKQFGGCSEVGRACPNPGEIEYLFASPESKYVALVVAGFDHEKVAAYLAKDDIGLHELRKELLPMLVSARVIEFFSEAEDSLKDAKGKIDEDRYPGSIFYNITRIADALEKQL